MRRLVFVGCVLLASVAGAQGEDGGAPDPDAGLSMPADAGVLLAAPAAPSPAPPQRSFVAENWHGTGILTRRPFLYEVGFVLGGGGLIHSPGVATVPMTGITVRERSGIVSALLIGLLGNALQASTAARVDNVRTTTEVNGNTVTTTTTATVTVLKTPEQLEREQAEFRSGVAGLTWIDLTVYADQFLGWNRGAPAGSGYEFSFGFQGEIFRLGGLPAVLDVGLQFANVRVPPPAGSGVGDQWLYYASGGALGRLIVPVSRFAAVNVEWILNFLSLDYLFENEAALRAAGRVVSSPLKLGVEVYLTDRVLLRAQGVLGGLGFTDGRLGGFLTAGVRL